MSDRRDSHEKCRELLKASRNDKHTVLTTLTLVNKRVELLTEENNRMDYELDFTKRMLEKEQKQSSAKAMEEMKIKVLKAETESLSAKMQIASWRERHDAKFDQVEALLKQVQELGQNHNKELVTLRDDNHKAREEVRKTKTELMSCQMEVASLKRDLDEARKSQVDPAPSVVVENVPLPAPLQEVEKLRMEKEKLEKEKSSCVKNLLEARRMNADGVKFKKESEEAAAKMKKEIEELKEERQSLYGELKSAHEAIEEMESGCEDCKKYKAEIEELNDENDEVYREKRRLAKNLEDTEKIVEQLEKSNKTISESDRKSIDDFQQARIDNMNRLNAELVIERDSLTEELKSERDKNAEKDKEAKSMTDEITVLRHKLEELESSMEVLNEESDYAASRNELMRKDLKKASDEKAEMERLAQSMKEKVEEFQLKLDQFEKDTAELKEEKEVLANENRRISGEVDDLKGKFSEMEWENERIRAMNNFLTDCGEWRNKHDENDSFGLEPISQSPCPTVQPTVTADETTTVVEQNASSPDVMQQLSSRNDTPPVLTSMQSLAPSPFPGLVPHGGYGSPPPLHSFYGTAPIHYGGQGARGHPRPPYGAVWYPNEEQNWNGF